MSIRSFFGVIFILSILTFGVFKYYPEFLSKIGVIEEKTNQIEPIQKGKDSAVYEKRYTPALNIEASIDANNDFIILTSLITSILSLIGFIVSTLYSMKTNKREEELYQLKKQREQLELEKIQEEIRALTKNQ